MRRFVSLVTAPCVPICTALNGRMDKLPVRTYTEQFGANCADEKQTAFAGTAGSKSKQVKGTGLLRLPRSGSQRTAMPTASGFYGFSTAVNDRGCKTTRMPAVGVAGNRNHRLCKEKVRGCDRRCKTNKEMDHV